MPGGKKKEKRKKKERKKERKKEKEKKEKERKKERSPSPQGARGAPETFYIRDNLCTPAESQTKIVQPTAQ